VAAEREPEVFEVAEQVKREAQRPEAGRAAVEAAERRIREERERVALLAAAQERTRVAATEKQREINEALRSWEASQARYKAALARQAEQAEDPFEVAERLKEEAQRAETNRAAVEAAERRIREERERQERLARLQQESRVAAEREPEVFEVAEQVKREAQRTRTIVIRAAPAAAPAEDPFDVAERMKEEAQRAAEGRAAVEAEKRRLAEAEERRLQLEELSRRAAEKYRAEATLLSEKERELHEERRVDIGGPELREIATEELLAEGFTEEEITKPGGVMLLPPGVRELYEEPVIIDGEAMMPEEARRRGLGGFPIFGYLAFGALLSFGLTVAKSRRR